ncbi:putative receptor protein kinase ZmPK1 [Lotus japonicus]|uniref:putative receptor protein kinase ZmPK1 n=1 Tax=Lotus japonicus TaxID=34305 RepID=UPI00258E4EC0|nr:putative receptor protein kinase ZmPK1 [Lotus japonicus]
MASSTSLFALLLLLFHVQHSSSFSLSVEKLEEDVIVSPNRTFTAGFYPAGENAYYFAIWFTQPHDQNTTITVVWIANRDQPVNGKRSTLSLLKTGNLILTDAGQSIVWSTDTNSNFPLEMHLQETGNLVLRNQNNKSSVLWQSFDFPTDTLLPDQSLKRHMKLVSSVSKTDYSSGFYKLIFDDDNVLRLLYDGPRISSLYWYDPWLVSWQAGRTTYNSSRVATLNRFGYFSSSDAFAMKASDYGSDQLIQRRLTLDHDGNVRVYSRKHYHRGQEGWSVTGQFRQEPCVIHGICGPNSICSIDPSSGRKCTCVPGYSRINNRDLSRGCKPNFQLSCNNNLSGSRSLFHLLPHVEFYGYDLGFQKNYTYKQCEDLCLQECSCLAFQYKISDGDTVFSCYTKTQLLNGRSSPDFQGSVFLRLPEIGEFSLKDNGLVCSRNGEGEQVERAYSKGKENGSVKFMLWFATGLGGVELVCIFLVWCFLIRNNTSKDNQGYVLAAATGFQRFSYSELKKATKGFSQEIGRGGGGTVYKGVLSDDRVAAIKVLHAAAANNQGESEFHAEVNFIGRLNHMNLIGMWGYCAEGKHRILVYEYMEKGSLAENLSSSNALDWGKRYNIALGTARGLAYLHEECLEWILHCDIKPQNILLGTDYQPKVADFGLSKLLQRNNLNNSSFSRIRGTRGYMAPEWVFNLPITSKVDVYSYGVVVLEMITGRSPMTGIQNGAEELLHHERLIPWVREIKRRNVSEAGVSWVEGIIDPALGTDYDMNKLETLATVALDCVDEEKDVRPSMSQVAQRLQSHQHDS